MTDERATIRPVTLSRLVETADLCAQAEQTADDIETRLSVSHRRARETLLEASRIDIISITNTTSEEEQYQITQAGRDFLNAILSEEWSRADRWLQEHSPHYKIFLKTTASIGPADSEELLIALDTASEGTPYAFNEATIDVVADWAERLGAVQRHAFEGTYYHCTQDAVPSEFLPILLDVFDELEEHAGVDLYQRYLSIPQLREETCARLGCSRSMFDAALVELVQANVGRLELSGAPIDTGAKDAPFGIKTITLSDGNNVVATTQSTDRVMQGVEQFNKQYYYLAVHDRDLTPRADQ